MRALFGSESDLKSLDNLQERKLALVSTKKNYQCHLAYGDTRKFLKLCNHFSVWKSDQILITALVLQITLITFTTTLIKIPSVAKP